MKKGPTRHTDAEDIVLDADSGEEIVAEESELSEAQLKHKLKEMRTALREAYQEKDENLAGWQRAKADLANFRRFVEEDKARDASRAKGAMVRAILPGIDSFESALKSEHWETIDATWRKGVEQIYDQLVKGLEKEACVPYGSPGDMFDPALHECMSIVPTTHDHADGTIVQVLQRGYSLGDEVIRPAKVIVAQSH